MKAGLLCRHFGKGHGIHKAVNLANANLVLKLDLKTFGNFVGAQTFLRRRIDIEDLRAKKDVLRRAWRRRCIKMFIIGAAVNPENPAKGFNGVFSFKNMHSI